MHWPQRLTIILNWSLCLPLTLLLSSGIWFGTPIILSFTLSFALGSISLCCYFHQIQQQPLSWKVALKTWVAWILAGSLGGVLTNFWFQQWFSEWPFIIGAALSFFLGLWFSGIMTEYRSQNSLRSLSIHTFPYGLWGGYSAVGFLLMGTLIMKLKHTFFWSVMWVIGSVTAGLFLRIFSENVPDELVAQMGFLLLLFFSGMTASALLLAYPLADSLKKVTP